MARALFNGKAHLAALSDRVVLSYRLFSAAASSGRGMMEDKAALAKGSMKTGAATFDDAAAPWVPDPVTGYYRPANYPNEIEPAELRQMFLKKKA